MGKNEKKGLGILVTKSLKARISHFNNQNLIYFLPLETEFTNIIAYVRRSHNDASYLAIRDMGAWQIVYINSITASKVNGKVGIAVNMTGSDIEEDVPS